MEKDLLVHAMCYSDSFLLLAEKGISRAMHCCLLRKAPPQCFINKALFVAVKSGNAETVRLLVERGASINEEIIHAAASKGQFQVVQYLLQNSDVQNSREVVLEWAAYYGELELVRKLVAEGVITQTWEGDALLWAARNCHFDVVRCLLEYNADIHAGQELTLTMAVRYGQLELVRQLLQRGAIVSDSTIAEAVQHGHIDVLECLLSQQQQPADLSAFFVLGNVEVLSFLHRRGFMVSRMDCALRAAAVNNRSEIIRALVGYGANVNATHAGERSILCLAATFDNVDLVQFLMEHGAEFDVKALVTAAIRGHEMTVHYLMSFVTQCPKEVFIAAARGGHVKVLQFLLPKSSLQWLDQALYNAVLHGCFAAMIYLLDAGGDIATRDNFPLRWAAEYSVSWIEILLRRGATVEVLHHYAFLWATKNNQSPAIEYLLGKRLNPTDWVMEVKQYALRWSNVMHEPCSLVFIMSREVIVEL